MYRINAIGTRGTLFSTDTIPGCVTNLYLVKGKGRNYLIDTGLGSDTAQYVKNFINNNCPNEVIVINTHYHWDHIWGNSVFEGNTIIAHRTTNQMIEEKWGEMESRCSKWKEGNIKKVLPNKFVEGRLTFPEDEIEIFHSPGHTCDSVSVYDRLDKVLHVGDNIEMPMPEIYDTKDHLIQSLNRCLEYDFIQCVSGHNGDVRRADIESVLKAL